ncbi:hypothetical protein M5K25_000945 [Dendrobium thyrsiflorum]|uniref:Peptide chain release factor domain-containing protein n=1 Tax=Dendrobium thyrsiflorum TaxID=117978 RepID=A0ABD0W7S1_DENTH
MAKVLVESLSSGKPTPFRLRRVPPARAHSSSSSFRAAQSMEGKNAKIYKELGLFSLKKKIEETVNRAEMITPLAMEFEEERRIKQEEVLRECNLWNDDLTTSNESLTALADAIRVVNDLKDMRHKAEEAKLITQLAEMDIINDQLFQQAYTASLDVNKFLDRYEMSKLLRGPYDNQGACMIIKAGMEGTASEIWTEKVLHMYARWAEKNGCNVTGLETFPSMEGGTKLATIEFEKEYMYGYLSGEKGIHRLIHSSLDGSTIRETWSASIDVIPLFLEKMIDFHIDDRDIEVSSPSHVETFCRSKISVSIQHIPSNTIVHCSEKQRKNQTKPKCERSQFANKMKALNRLKAKLLVMAMEERLETLKIKNDDCLKENKYETRRYMLRHQKSVHDIKTGMILPDLNSVLDGNIEPFIRAHICLRRGRKLG